jgi:hypothetical protein
MSINNLYFYVLVSVLDHWQHNLSWQASDLHMMAILTISNTGIRYDLRLIT